MADKTEFFVIGGEYTNTSFTKLSGKLESFGPFSTFDEAYKKWRAVSFLKIDNCHTRYEIIEEVLEFDD